MSRLTRQLKGIGNGAKTYEKNAYFDLSNMEMLVKHIVMFRKSRGLSQEAFANLCNLNRTYISSIERHGRNVSLKTLEAIANTMSIPLFQLFIPPASNNHCNHVGHG